MSQRIRIGIAVIAIICGVAVVARATPPVGIIHNLLLSNASTGLGETFQHALVYLPHTATQSGATWGAVLYTTGQSDARITDLLIAPGGQTGWHAHPGIVVVSVLSGVARRYDSHCASQDYKAGQVFIESTSPHNVRSVGQENLHSTAFFLLAHGQAPRIDRPAPPCAASVP